jgi:hypothetical protein
MLLICDGNNLRHRPRLAFAPGSGRWKRRHRADARRWRQSCPRTNRAKLSDGQLVILTTAAQRTDGSLLPFPQSLTAKGAALNRVVGTLCKRKLAEERRTISGAPEWRRDEERRPLGLFITTNGLVAVGIDDPEKARPSQAVASMPRQRKTAAARLTRKTRKVSPHKRKERAASSQSKQDLVIQMLRRQSGVTIEDIIAKTGWQSHSVRGFFSGLVKKKLKLPLVSEVGKDGVRHYHIAPIESAKA